MFKSKKFKAAFRKQLTKANIRFHFRWTLRKTICFLVWKSV